MSLELLFGFGAFFLSVAMIEAIRRDQAQNRSNARLAEAATGQEHQHRKTYPKARKGLQYWVEAQ